MGGGYTPDPLKALGLTLRYKPCEPWETESVEAALERLQAVSDAERAALRRKVRGLTKAKLQFEREKQWVKFFLQSDGSCTKAAPAAPEVVEMIVGHCEAVCVKRSTLMLCAESPMARRFDAETWAQESACGGESDDEDEDDAGRIHVEEEEPYHLRDIICFS